MNGEGGRGGGITVVVDLIEDQFDLLVLEFFHLVDRDVIVDDFAEIFAAISLDDDQVARLDALESGLAGIQGGVEQVRPPALKLHYIQSTVCRYLVQRYPLS